jgi:tripartite ATP-independent transporter DctP family solute receptor
MGNFSHTAFKAVAAAALAVACSTAFAQTKEVKLGYALPIASHYGAGAAAWAETTEKASNGALKFRQFPSSALGGERELIESLQLGTVEAAIVSTGTLSNFVPDVGVMDIPFLFRDADHARHVLDGPIGQGILDKFSGRGLIALAWGEQGFRHVTNNKRAVEKPEDLKGLKLRTMENPVHITAFRTFGAAPTPMSWPEVTGALQQGTIDGQENPLSVIVSSKLSQVQKHLTLTGHVYSPVAILVSPAFWNGLTPDQQKAVRDGAKAAAAATRKYVEETDRKAVDELKAQGMQVVVLQDKSPFQKALDPAYKQYSSKYGKELLDKIAAEK